MSRERRRVRAYIDVLAMVLAQSDLPLFDRSELHGKEGT
jgi:hypothetical protein